MAYRPLPEPDDLDLPFGDPGWLATVHATSADLEPLDPWPCPEGSKEALFAARTEAEARATRRASKMAERAMHWLINSRPPMLRVYHSGNLMADRQHSKEVDAVAGIMRRAWLAGIVHLRQQRTGPGMIDYIAVRTAEPWPGELPPDPDLENPDG